MGKAGARWSAACGGTGRVSELLLGLSASPEQAVSREGKGRGGEQGVLGGDLGSGERGSTFGAIRRLADEGSSASSPGAQGGDGVWRGGEEQRRVGGGVLPPSSFVCV